MVSPRLKKSFASWSRIAISSLFPTRAVLDRLMFLFFRTLCVCVCVCVADGHLSVHGISVRIFTFLEFALFDES